MRTKKFKYDKIKKVIYKNRSDVCLVRDVIDEKTEEPSEIVIFIDPDHLDERIVNLQQEIDELKVLQNRIKSEQFDSVIDHRPPTKEPKV